MALVRSGYGFYEGTFYDIKRAFNLTNKATPIFERYFNGNSTDIINIEKDSIYIPNHFFVTGEEISYTPHESELQNSIGIGTTSIQGIGLTDKLPSTLYIVKLNDLTVQVSASASESLSSTPKVLDITSIGIGTLHIFKSKNQNAKALISIDNVIQSPIVSTSITTFSSNQLSINDNSVDLIDIDSFFAGDLIKIDEEIMKITQIGFGTFSNRVIVQRPWMGTGISTHASNSLVTKVDGNYNIVDNVLNFVEAPYGLTPIGTITNPPDERDYTGISTHSTFSGRIFLRSGISDSNNETYYQNYVFDDISSNFIGLGTQFTLKSNGANVTGFSTSNAIVLINNVFQQPSRINLDGNYALKESSGITSIRFIGITSLSTEYDINTKNVPRGGIIVSVGSTEGFGYQPLVSAGGTSIVSIAGTISSISIGNSGSGYRSGIQTNVRVGVTTLGIGTVGVEFVGIASISNGHVVNVTITNPGSGYTSTNPPIVIFDEPLSYSDIPLIYSSSSSIGIGTKSTIDIIVGQGSSVINFELKNCGYSYTPGEILTIATGGTTGIPINTSLTFKEFQITVNETFSDKFNGWSIGDLQVLDSIDNLFDGRKTDFPIKINNQKITIRSKKGSNIDVQATLLVFINDILQVPGKGYFFNGGSTIKFSEPPKSDDKSKIIFYKGTGDVDTVLVDVLETIKTGDDVTINSDSPSLQENERLVTDVVSSDVINTNVYPGPGISQDQNLLRPLVWCKQTDDKIIDGKEIGKDRTIYESLIYPTTNLIHEFDVDSTELFVENVKTFFDNVDEFNTKNNKITIYSQDTLISAAATAVVSVAGTISSIVISDGGVGYSTSPLVSIASPISTGSTTNVVATAIANISISETVSSISIVNPGSGYTSSNPPLVLIEPPTPKTETISNVVYNGDFGLITGIKTTSVGVASTGIVFDFYIPEDSFLRDITVVGTAITLSGIQTGYYFVIHNSNVGNGVTSLNSSGSVIGIGSTFIDNIYYVSDVSIGQTAVPGVGITFVAKVTVSLSSYNGLTGLGFSGLYGEYSWGRISNLSRKNKKSFSIYNNGILGVSTSPIVQRFNPLKYQNYLT